MARHPDRRASRNARPAPQVRESAVTTALQALLRAVPWHRRRAAQAMVRAVGAQPAAVQELHEGPHEAGRRRRRGRDLDAVRRHPRLDRPWRAARAGGVRRVADRVLPARGRCRRRDGRRRRQVRRRRGHRPVHPELRGSGPCPEGDRRRSSAHRGDRTVRRVAKRADPGRRRRAHGHRVRRHARVERGDLGLHRAR